MLYIYIYIYIVNLVTVVEGKPKALFLFLHRGVGMGARFTLNYSTLPLICSFYCWSFVQGGIKYYF